MQAAHVSVQAQELMDEDRAVCGRLAVPAHTDRFSRCAIELSWVRAQERRRVMADFETLP